MHGDIDIAPVKGPPEQKMVSHKPITTVGGQHSATHFHFSHFVAVEQLVEKDVLRPGGAGTVVFQAPKRGHNEYGT